ncbi:tetratricopeptide repeat protein [Stackebrandtia albiflava]|uniref:Tetratricopeptide repeat protein n=1 Tax=Stackebrandtia albiflava TaxID=406432 RepID=A0A562VC55_9ACTN|nr:tetratricopeptide repeat protein [Stackebrandtia albiflava]TWJ15442.1 tetratricopeptide repeat protein [Stackebrandtia albiflava]
MKSGDRLARAKSLYWDAVYGGEPGPLAEADRLLDGVEADLALARGRIVHTRFLRHGIEDPREGELFSRALELYRGMGEVRGEAEALFWLGTWRQLIEGDLPGAEADFARALELASEVDDAGIMAEATRHLGIVAHREGRLEEARQHLEESNRLRRLHGPPAGVAANLVGLIYIAAAQDRRDDALDLVAQAREICAEHSAAAIATQVEEAASIL